MRHKIGGQVAFLIFILMSLTGCATSSTPPSGQNFHGFIDLTPRAPIGLVDINPGESIFEDTGGETCKAVNKASRLQNDLILPIFNLSGEAVGKAVIRGGFLENNEAEGTVCRFIFSATDIIKSNGYILNIPLVDYDGQSDISLSIPNKYSDIWFVIGSYPQTPTIVGTPSSYYFTVKTIHSP
jgi:hypothetical protein